MRPVAGSTTSWSWWSQPGWFSSEPWWWSMLKSDRPGGLGGRAQVDGGLAAPGPDLHKVAPARWASLPARTAAW